MNNLFNVDALCRGRILDKCWVNRQDLAIRSQMGKKPLSLREVACRITGEAAEASDKLRVMPTTIAFMRTTHHRFIHDKQSLSRHSCCLL